MSGIGNRSHLRARFTRILGQPQSRSINSKAGPAAIGFLIVVLAGCASFNTRESGKVYKIGGEVSTPKIIHKIQPEYSEAARKDKLQGSVLLGVTIGADGKPKNIQVLRGLRSDLDANAIAAVTQWQFSPAVRQGSPVAVSAHVEINFKLL
jgi:TonB family protein